MLEQQQKLSIILIETQTKLKTISKEVNSAEADVLAATTVLHKLSRKVIQLKRERDIPNLTEEQTSLLDEQIDIAEQAELDSECELERAITALEIAEDEAA